MADLTFDTKVNWSGIGKEGQGTIVMGEEHVVTSGPSNMGGKGVGASPEDLLIAAVTSCYSGTLFGYLTKKGLPVKEVSVHAEGLVTGHPLNTKFSKLTVNPIIIGGDTENQTAYEQAAVKSRDKCFIGKSIKGNIEYVVGEVKVISES